MERRRGRPPGPPGIPPLQLGGVGGGSGGVVKPRSWISRTLRPMARGSLRGCIFTLMSAAIGPGAMLLPYMFRLVGVPLGLLCLSFGAYTSAQALRFIISLVYLTGRDSYPASVAAVLGPAAGSTLSHITTFILLLGTGGHLKFLAELIRNMMGPALREVAPAQLVAIAAVFPVSARRDISFLRHAALIAPIALLYVLALIVVRGLGSSQAAADGMVGGRDGPATPAAVTGDMLRIGDGGLWELPRAWTLVLNAFTCHHLAVPIYKELHCAKAQRVNKVVLRSITSISLLYTLVGACGFLTHGMETPENILLAYPRSDSAAFLAQALLSCALLVSLPLNVHALRGHLLETLPGPFANPLRGASPLGRLASTAGLIGVPAMICNAFPSITAIVGVCVGYGLVTYTFIMPAAALCALRWGSSAPGGGGPGSFASSGRSGSHESFQDLLLSSPLSSPLLSPRLGSMVTPCSSHPDIAGLDQEACGDVPELEMPELELPPDPAPAAAAAAGGREGPGAIGESDASPVFQMQSLPPLAHDGPCDRDGRAGSCSPTRRGIGCYSDGARSPSPSPSDDGFPATTAQWSSEFPLALASLAVGTCLGMTAATRTLLELLLGS